MVVRRYIPVFIKNNPRTYTFTDKNLTVKNIAVIDFRRNADDSGADLLTACTTAVLRASDNVSALPSAVCTCTGTLSFLLTISW